MRNGMKVLGLALLASISMMAVTAAAAHAEGEIRVEGKVLGSGENEFEYTGEGGASKFKVPGLGLTIACTSSKWNSHGGNLPHLHGLVLRLRHGCNIEGVKTCTIYPTEEDLLNKTNGGLIHLHALELWLRRRNGRSYYRISDILGQGIHARIYYGGALCSLPKETDITGVGVIAVPEDTVEAVQHEYVDVSPAEESELISEGMTDIGLKYGKESLEVEDGSVKGGLVGKFEGKKFSDN